MLGGVKGCCRRAHGPDHIATGDTGLQGFGTGSLDGGQPMIEHRAQHLDELSISVGVLLQLDADLGQRNVSTTLRQPAFEFKLGLPAFGLAG
jgi:hypothetical protein